MPGTPVSNRRPGLYRDRRGFTLLELLTVVAILATVAFVAAGRMGGLQQQTSEQLVHTEMQEIATAIRRFKQDTGYYPKTGPFGLVGPGFGPITDAVLSSQKPHAGANPTNRARWFYSPANFYQLVSNPLSGTGHQLENWNPETGRGWRGPYLQGFRDGFVDIGDGINDGTPAGSPGGDPLTGSTAPDVDGIADTFEHKPENNRLLGWSAAAGGTKQRTSWGRPYLLFDLDGHPRLVSMGPDGTYGTDDDIILNIE